MNSVVWKVEENMEVKGVFKGVTKAEAENSVLNIPMTAQGSFKHRRVPRLKLSRKGLKNANNGLIEM